MDRGRKVIIGVASAVVLLFGLVIVVVKHPWHHGDVVIGVPSGTSTSTSGPLIIIEPTTTAAPPTTARTAPAIAGTGFVDPARLGAPGAEPRSGPGLAPPDGHPWPPAIAFTTSQPVPSDLIFTLVVGSDARPGEDLLHSRSDSIHLVAVNPVTRQGTMVGFPRDSWVEIPGHGRGKINDALAIGGPNLLAQTVRKLTGLPVDYYVLTGFEGLTAMVNEVGGVDVSVDRRMNDVSSGARFERGWHHFTGAQALAYSRDRHDVEYGDFTRSEHQGKLILAGLAKMRAEIADDNGIGRWISILVRHVDLDVPLQRLPQLAALARQLSPDRITNVVAPGRVGSTGGRSVVFLTRDAATLFNDLRDDAVVGTAAPEPTATTTTPAPAPSSTSTSTTSTSTTTTTSTTVVPTTTTTIAVP